MKGVAIGAGYFSAFHYDAWQRLGEISPLVALCDTDEAKSHAMAAQYGIAKVYTNYIAMLDAEKPGFIDIITPPSTHLNLVREAASRNISVLCQKPLAPTLAEAEEIVRIAEDAQIRLMVHENFRFQPWHREIKRQLDFGVIGTLHSLNIRTRLGDGWQPDAYMARQPYFRTMPRLLIFETGVHFLDLMRFYGGEIENIQAWLSRRNPDITGEDSGLIVAQWKNGGRAVWDADRYAEPLDNNDPRLTFGEFIFEGSAGRLFLGTSGRLTKKLLGQEEEEIIYQWQKRGFAGDCVYNTLQHFVERLADGLPFETEGRDYLNNIKLQEKIYQPTT
jgi:D-apiose dehydrogenase